MLESNAAMAASFLRPNFVPWPITCWELPWIKVLNPNYSQREGRRELFEKKRAHTAR
jgi:hypothetical protein